MHLHRAATGAVREPLPAAWDERYADLEHRIDVLERNLRAARDARDALVPELRAAGLSQAQIARRMRISQQRVSQLLRKR